MFIERVHPDYRKDEPGIIVGQAGRYWLCLVDPLSLATGLENQKIKLDVLIKFGKNLPGDAWVEVLVDINWDNREREFIVKRKFTPPYSFKGEVIYVRSIAS